MKWKVMDKILPVLAGSINRMNDYITLKKKKIKKKKKNNKKI
jgi:hypothetical protein